MSGIFGAFTATHLLYLAQGAVWTVALSMLAFLLGGIAGFGVMLMRISRWAWLRAASAAVSQVVQGIPLMVLLFLSYYGVGMMGIDVPPLLAASLAMMIYTSVFLGDIWRGSVESMARTQWEAAECLSLTRWQAIRLVIVPQAVRLSLPSTVGFLVQVLKSTSLASVIGFVEITRAAQIVNNAIFQPFLVFSLVGAFYFLLCYPLSRWSRQLERKLNVRNR